MLKMGVNINDIYGTEKIVEEYANAVRRQYPQTKQYHILIFGSFQTDQYNDDSDIDIGTFFLVQGLSYRLHSFTKDYLKAGIASGNSGSYNKKKAGSFAMEIKIVLENVQIYTDEYEIIRKLLWNFCEKEGLLSQ